MKDATVQKLIASEEKRQKSTINLIASENYVSQDVRNALASVFANKYAEGYPGARYYAGNAVVDTIENLARERALVLFDLSRDEWSVNVQPYSGSPANLAIYLALVPAGEKIMGMRLDMGGHLTHGHHVSITGKLWRQISYGVDQKSEMLDYDAILKIAEKERPKLIVAGYTAYSRAVDFARFREIANAVSAYLAVDLSHLAGLVAGGVYPSPFSTADIVMTTTHKTLRGPRAALIFSRVKHASAVDKAVFPGLQGGPHINQIAAVAVALKEASTSAFKRYAERVVRNARALAHEMTGHGWRVVSGGTDSHLFLVDTFSKSIGGGAASDILERVGIIVNKNTIPYDSRSPQDPSGIRIGTAAVTTRGMKEKDMRTIAGYIHRALSGERVQKIAGEVTKFIKKFPLQ